MYSRACSAKIDQRPDLHRFTVPELLLRLGSSALPRMSKLQDFIEAVLTDGLHAKRVRYRVSLGLE